MSPPRILPIDPAKPGKTLIAEAAKVLKNGGIVAYPTETFYGLGADGTNEEAIEKIFFLKGRASTTPLSVIIGGEEDMIALTVSIDEPSRRLIREFWPGPLTLVLPAAPHVSTRLTAETGRIGIRVSSHPIASCLARALGRPLTATSANTSGTAECTSPEEVLRSLGSFIDIVIDGGITPGGLGSTVLDVTRRPPVIVRAGVIPASRLWEVIDAMTA